MIAIKMRVLLVFCWCVLTPAAALAQLSTAEPALIPYALPKLVDGSVDFGDFDGDGDLDLVVTGLIGHETPLTRVYSLQDSAFVEVVSGFAIQQVFKVYRPVQSIVNHVWQGTAKFGDYDGDGDDDVLLFGLTYVDRTVDERVIEPVGELYQNRNGILVQQPIDIPDLHSGDAAWGDMDGDGDLDFAACGASSLTPPYRPLTIVYQNEGGSLNALDTSLPGAMLCSLAWGDSDGDGDLDLAISGESTEGIVTRVYENTGSNFRAMDVSLPGMVLGDMAWADFDGDGRDDLLAVGGILDPQLLRGEAIILRSIPGGFERLSPDDLIGVVAGSAAWGDYDADGDPDIILTGAESVLGRLTGRILLNDNGVFRTELVLAGLTQGDMAVGDYNGDGDIDILMIGLNDEGTSFTNFLMNRSFPELIPAGLIQR